MRGAPRSIMRIMIMWNMVLNGVRITPLLWVRTMAMLSDGSRARGGFHRGAKDMCLYHRIVHHDDVSFGGSGRPRILVRLVVANDRYGGAPPCLGILGDRDDPEAIEIVAVPFVGDDGKERWKGATPPIGG